MGGWIGVDLDGTLAEYGGWQGPDHIGAPIEPMAARVRAWLEADRDVRIFTARAGVPEQIPPIEAWCLRHFGRVLPVTDRKDFGMVELWDDRCVQVIPNTGMCAADPGLSPNARWLTLAHNLCADAGVPSGHIADRLEGLRKVLESRA